MENITDELNKLYTEAKKYFNLGEIQNSIKFFKEGLEKGLKIYKNEFSYDLAKFYYGYGTALLARLESKCEEFGKEIAQEQQEERVKGIEESKNNSQKSDSNENSVKDIEVAWQNLEVARAISQKRWEEIKNSKTFTQQELDDCQIKIVKVKLRLGDLEYYRGRFEEALKEYNECLEIQKKLEDSNLSRQLSEIYYLIGNAKTYLNTTESLNEALINYNESRVIIENIIKKELGLTHGRFFGQRNIFGTEQKLNKELLKETDKDTVITKELKKVLSSIYDKIEEVLVKQQKCQFYQQENELNTNELNYTKILDLDWLLDEHSFTFGRDPKAKKESLHNNENIESNFVQKKIKKE